MRGEPTTPRPPQGQGLRARLTRRVHRLLTESRYGMAVLFVASFLETTIVPIPIEVVLIPYMLANRAEVWRVWWIATVALAGCLLGALVGYGVGFFLFESVGHWLIETAGYQAEFQIFQRQFREYGFWAIMAVAVTPIPFQVAMLLAGVTGYSLALFGLASLAGRSLRYYGLAVLVLVFGEMAMRMWRRHARAASMIALAVVIAAAVLMRWLTAGQ